MVDFIDYYQEFEIDRTATCDEIREKLGRLESDYLQQRAVCITTAQMEVLQKLLNMIDDAIYNITNESRRKKYDKKLEQYASSGALSVTQTKANDDYEQAVICENKGKIKEAILFVERAISQNVYNKDAYALMIRCCYKIGDHQKAIDIAEEKAIKIYPDELSFQQYAARIRTLHADYEGADYHIQNMIRKQPNDSAGHIEKVVRALYMSEDRDFSDEQRKQMASDAEYLIEQYLNKHSNDLIFRDGVATALIGISEKYYSEYEGVSCKIIDSGEDYNAIYGLHERAGKICSDVKVQEALDDIREQGKKKYNQDNTNSLLCLGAFSIYAIVAGFAMVFESFAAITTFIPLILISVVPFVLLAKVSFRPKWMIDRIRYTGHIDTLERIMVAYGSLAIQITKWSWEVSKAIFRFAISIATGR